MMKILLILYILFMSLIFSGCSDTPKEYEEDEYQEVLNDVGLNKTPNEIITMIENHEKNRDRNW